MAYGLERNTHVEGDVVGGAIVRKHVKDGATVQPHPNSCQCRSQYLGIASLPIPASQQDLGWLNRSTRQSCCVYRL